MRLSIVLLGGRCYLPGWDTVGCFFTEVRLERKPGAARGVAKRWVQRGSGWLGIICLGLGGELGGGGFGRFGGGVGHATCLAPAGTSFLRRPQTKPCFASGASTGAWARRVERRSGLGPCCQVEGFCVPKLSSPTVGPA